MDYWQGNMNWPINPYWICQTCETSLPRFDDYILYGLTWGFINGECRCDICHTKYTMREDKTILTTPVCLLKDEYKLPAKLAWKKYHTPIDELSDSQWDELLLKDKDYAKLE